MIVRGYCREAVGMYSWKQRQDGCFWLFPPPPLNLQQINVKLHALGVDTGTPYGLCPSVFLLIKLP